MEENFYILLFDEAKSKGFVAKLRLDLEENGTPQQPISIEPTRNLSVMTYPCFREAINVALAAVPNKMRECPGGRRLVYSVESLNGDLVGQPFKGPSCGGAFGLFCRRKLDKTLSSRDFSWVTVAASISTQEATLGTIDQSMLNEKIVALRKEVLAGTCAVSVVFISKEQKSTYIPDGKPWAFAINHGTTVQSGSSGSLEEPLIIVRANDINEVIKKIDKLESSALVGGPWFLLSYLLTAPVFSRLSACAITLAIVAIWYFTNPAGIPVELLKLVVVPLLGLLVLGILLFVVPVFVERLRGDPHMRLSLDAKWKLDTWEAALRRASGSTGSTLFRPPIAWLCGWALRLLQSREWLVHGDALSTREFLAAAVSHWMPFLQVGSKRRSPRQMVGLLGTMSIRLGHWAVPCFVVAVLLSPLQHLIAELIPFATEPAFLEIRSLRSDFRYEHYQATNVGSGNRIISIFGSPTVLTTGKFVCAVSNKRRTRRELRIASRNEPILHVTEDSNPRFDLDQRVPPPIGSVSEVNFWCLPVVRRGGSFDLDIYYVFKFELCGGRVWTNELSAGRLFGEWETLPQEFPVEEKGAGK